MPHDVDGAAKQDSSVGSAGMSAEAKALLGQVVFNDPKGFGAHAMEFGQFRARDAGELTHDV